MSFSRCFSLLALSALTGSVLAGAGGITTEQVLLQTAVLNSDPGGVSIDHAHIVCHSEGCAEVHAKLKVIQERTAKAKEKLAECAKNRAALEADLQAAATKRAKVEAELQECADKRKSLTAELAQCGKDRVAAETGLAHCGAERAKLEAELRQCAEVDRPAAEKKLQECATERAKLEKALAAVVQKLKGGGGASPPKKSSRRRRRNKRSSSLAQTDAEEGTETEASLQAEESRLISRIAELGEEAKNIGGQIDAIFRRAEVAAREMDRVGIDELRFAKNAKDADEREEKIIAGMERLSKKADRIEGEMQKDSGIGDRVKGDLRAAEQAQQEAQTDLVKNAIDRARTTQQLLMLSLDAQHVRHDEIKILQDEQQRDLGALKVKLAMQEKDDHEECDQTRAEVIAAQAKAEETKAALDECLAMKKFIQSKIDAATKASEMASKALEACIAQKAKLKSALEECHSKRDRAREKLKECLDRKEIIKVKIAECHKARDSARAKLAECLKRKQELKNKIQDAGGKIGSSLLDADHASQAEAMQEALTMFRDENDKFKAFLLEEQDHSRRLGDLAKEITGHSEDEKSLREQLVDADSEEAIAQGGLQGVQESLQEVDDKLSIATREDLAAAAAAAASVKDAGGELRPPPAEKDAKTSYSS